MSKCINCSKNIKYQCRCSSFGCDEGFLRVFCDEQCRDDYEDHLIPRAIRWIDELPQDKRTLLNEILGDDDVAHYLWYKYFRI